MDEWVPELSFDSKQFVNAKALFNCASDVLLFFIKSLSVFNIFPIKLVVISVCIVKLLLLTP